MSDIREITIEGAFYNDWFRKKERAVNDLRSLNERVVLIKEAKKKVSKRLQDRIFNKARHLQHLLENRPDTRI